MSLDTYANLQTSLANTLHRSDLTGQIPDFITLAEDRLNKRLRLRAMESRQTTGIVAGDEYIALPTNFLALRNLQINTTPRLLLRYATPDYLDIIYPHSDIQDKPKFYSFVGGQIQLAPISDAAYTVEIDFYAKWNLATDSTNWLLTNAPRCYYYGALMEAAPYLKDDNRIAVWGSLLEKAIQEVITADDEDKFPDGSGLSVRPDFQAI